MAARKPDPHLKLLPLRLFPLHAEDFCLGVEQLFFQNSQAVRLGNSERQAQHLRAVPEHLLDNGALLRSKHGPRISQDLRQPYCRSASLSSIPPPSAPSCSGRSCDPFVPEGLPDARRTLAGALRAALTSGRCSLGSLSVVMNGPNRKELPAMKQSTDSLAAQTAAPDDVPNHHGCANPSGGTTIFGELMREFLPDYLRLVEPDSAEHLRLEEATFPPLQYVLTLEEGAVHTGLGMVVAFVPTKRTGEFVTVLIQVEPEPLGPAETSRRIGQLVVALELRYSQPMLVSVVYLRGARPGINLESAVACKVFDMEVLRCFYTTFGLSETRAEYYLDRPEPLAWALAALMRPTRRSRPEHKLACLKRIAAAGLPAQRKHLLERCVEDWMVLTPTEQREYHELNRLRSCRDGAGAERSR